MIAVFYTDEIQVGWLAAAVVGLVVVGLMRRATVWYAPAHVVVGLAVWGCMLASGIHATIAGVALGLLTPARPLLSEPEARQIAEQPSSDGVVTAGEVRELTFGLRESVSVAERWEQALHPWTSYIVIPVFALANAGIPLSGEALGDAVGSSVTQGVVAGLVLGKLVGISAFSWLAVRIGFARLPVGVRWAHVVGMAAVAGIGFTVSIFVAGLAYRDVGVQDEAKIGILVASVVTAIVGSIVLGRVAATTSEPTH